MSEQVDLKISYTDFFNKQFPYYLAIGMTCNQYWDEDVCLAEYYRKAEEIRKEQMNQKLWLQGMYIYDAISRLSPILRAFGKKGAKPQPYVEEAYPISDKAIKEKEQEKARKHQEKNKRLFESYMVSHNQRFKEGK